MIKVKVTTPESKDRRSGSIKVNQKDSGGWKLDIKKIAGKKTGSDKKKPWPTKASQRDVGQAPRHCDVPMADMGDKWVCPVDGNTIKKKKK